MGLFTRFSRYSSPTTYLTPFETLTSYSFSALSAGNVDRFSTTFFFPRGTANRRHVLNVIAADHLRAFSFGVLQASFHGSFVPFPGGAYLSLRRWRRLLLFSAFSGQIPG